MFGFRKNVKASFRRMREHIEVLGRELRANREFIIVQNKQLETQNSQILGLLQKIKGLEEPKPKKNEEITQKTTLDLQKGPNLSSLSVSSSPESRVSKGNNGVSLDGYSLAGYSLDGYSLNIHRFKEELPTILSRLSKQEFLTFLTVYHQEEQGIKVTYETVAEELKITPGCVRTYVSGLLKKKLPVLKTKYNNRLIILSIPSEIRGLNLKKHLIQEFYKQDPNQTRLGNDF